MNGVEQYDPIGEPFNPELHNALFKVPDADKKPGHVAAVVKVRVLLGRTACICHGVCMCCDAAAFVAWAPCIPRWRLFALCIGVHVF